MKRLLKTLFLLSIYVNTFAQMPMGTDTLFGHEWINFNQTYYKIKVSADGLYRIDKNQLEAAGVPMNSISANQLKLFHFGKEVPLYMSADGNLSDNDYLLFWGKQNRGEMDHFLFAEPEEDQLNPFYSLVTDTSSYFLTWNNEASPARYQTLESDLSQAPAKEPWVWSTYREVFTEKFMKNYTRRSGITIYYSNYNAAEGYGNRDINELLAAGSTTQTFNIDLPKAYTAGPEANFSARFGTGRGEHHQLVKVNGTTYFERNFFNVAVSAPDFNFPLNGNQTEVVFEGQIDDRDEQSIGYLQIKYPKEPHAGNQSIFAFELDGSTVDKYLEIEGFNAGNGIPVLYDQTNNLRINCRFDNGLVKALLPARDGKRELILVEESSNTASVNNIQAHPFFNLIEQSADFLILTSPELRKTYENEDQVQAYADYRQSPQGGSFTPKIVEVQDLYDQFGYGIHRHPQSIRNFVRYAKRSWPNLRYVFIIGKGREYVTIRSAEGLAAAAGQSYFVPSFGFPASDNLMLSTNSSSVAIVPVGRIAATEPKEINIYLNKVKALEETLNNGQTIEERAWMKNIVHLGGGGNAAEQSAIKFRLDKMEREISQNLFGGRVNPFYKSGTETMELSKSQQIFNRINDGAAMVTFFGHSSPGTFDFNIDNPDNYSNYSKYPFILSLGCYSGNFFTSTAGIGERFTFYEDRIGVAFGASRGVGFISSLGTFATYLYQTLGGVKYGAGLGDIIRATRQNFDNHTSLEMKTIIQQFTLHGDPSIRLYPMPGPDYVVDRSSVTFSPKVVSIQEDSFELKFDILNLGQYIQDSISLNIKQKLPDGKVKMLKALQLPAPAYSQTVAVKLNTLGKSSIGLNTIFIEVDPENAIAELPNPAAEANNNLSGIDGELGINLFVVDNTVRPLAPLNFAVAGKKPLSLKAFTSNALASKRKYLLEIDTTLLFNSPAKERTEISQVGGLITWTPSMPMMDSTVYYWRISSDSIESGIGYVWETSSFTYLEDSPGGWGQGHHWQWTKGEGSNLEYLDSGRGFDFDFIPLDMSIKNKVYEDADRPGFIYNNGGLAGSVRPWGYLDEGVAVMVGIPRDGHFWVNTGRSYGSVDGNGKAVFSFRTSTSEERKVLIDFLEEVIPSDHYVYLFTVQRNPTSSFYPELWATDSLEYGTNLFQVLEKQGSRQIRLLKERGSVPYAFMYHKDKGGLNEDMAADINGQANVGSVFPEYREFGTYNSPVIGPARSWGSLQFGLESFSDGDTTSLSIYGITTNEEEILLREDIFEPLSLDFINAEEYPQLKLVMEAKTRENRPPKQLHYWHVIYEGLPESLVAPNLTYEFNNDTLQQGQDLNLKVAIANVSEVDMDSLLLQYTLTSPSNDNTIFSRRMAPLTAGDTLQASFNLPTTDKLGKYNILLEVNPSEDQAELFHFNNFLDQSFLIEGDQKKPILDVTFDGNHILNGDLVSVQPIIVVKLKDENPYLELSDTSLFLINLQYPDQTSRRINFDRDDIIFYPANLAEGNTATIEFSPLFVQSGQYKLSIQARDVSGNSSGTFAYEVEFEVITEKMISNVLNYPNPFSTSTQFVYTITGEIPTYFSIQIMTVSGRVIKEIRQEELGTLRVGTHKTEYAWDGTDDYGDQLANGVYFYRIVAKDGEGKDYESYQNGTDKFFKNGLGKMVLLR